SDPCGLSLSAVLVSNPTHGSLTLNSNGSFSYVPAANYTGPDSFTYQASDGQANTTTVTVTLTVSPMNDAPVAADDAFTTSEDTMLTVSVPGLLANDSDVDGDPLTSVLVSNPTHGTLTLNGDGSFTYTPATNYNGPDSFTYQVSDGQTSSG